MQNPATTGKALPHSPIIEEPVDNRETEDSPLMGQALGANSSRNTLDIEERRSSEIPVVYSETSSLSESTYVDSFQDKLKVSRYVSLFGYVGYSADASSSLLKLCDVLVQWALSV